MVRATWGPYAAARQRVHRAY